MPAYERPRTLPMRMTCTVVVRAPYRATLERRSKRLRPAPQETSAPRSACYRGSSEPVGLLWSRCDAPPVASRPAGRDMDGGMSLPVLGQHKWHSRAGCRSVRPRRRCLQHASPRNKSRHLCWYGTSAPTMATARACCSRAGAARMGCESTAMDQGEQREHARRLYAYLGGTAFPIRMLAVGQAFHFTEVVGPDVVCGAGRRHNKGPRQYPPSKAIGWSPAGHGDP
jgi:hypothetical protein